MSEKKKKGQKKREFRTDDLAQIWINQKSKIFGLYFQEGFLYGHHPNSLLLEKYFNYSFLYCDLVREKGTFSQTILHVLN